MDNKGHKDKGHKIAGAVFLVTEHLNETDPLRIALRTHALSLVVQPPTKREPITDILHSLLEIGAIALVIKESNVRTIQVQLKYFGGTTYQPLNEIDQLFLLEEQHTNLKGHLKDNKRTLGKTMSFTTKNETFVSKKNKRLINGNKAKRQETIVSFIKDKKSATVKDISALFPAISDKTIQRELGVLVGSGKIIKRGDKRWSIYMSV